MIDFLKIVIYDTPLIEKVWNNTLLEFFETKERRVSVDEVKTFKKKKYRNLIFERCYNRLEITGSWHTFSNNGIHNANDYSFIDSISTTYQIKDSFGLDLSLCKIVNLEYGVNLVPVEDVRKIILWLKYHNRNQFVNFPDLKYAKHSQTYKKNGSANKFKFIKAYAKGLQPFDGKTYGDKNTFRFEVKSKESKYINTLGLKTLNDLTNIETYYNLSEALLKEWMNILILDMNLKSENDNHLKKYLNTDFWEESQFQYRNHFSRNKQKYLSILQQYPSNIFNNIKNLIESKITIFKTELLKEVQIRRPDQIEKRCKFDGNQKSDEVQIRPYIKAEDAPLCKLTRINISMQKKNSSLLSITGLKYYHKNDHDLFLQIKTKYLTKKWENADFNTQIKEIAHNIRDNYRRKKNKEKQRKSNRYDSLKPIIHINKFTHWTLKKDEKFTEVYT